MTPSSLVLLHSIQNSNGPGEGTSPEGDHRDGTYWPLLVFKDLQGMAASWVLENRPFPQDILAVGVEELAEQLQEISHHRVELKRAHALQQAARNSVGVTEGLAAARLRLKVILEEIRLASHQLEQIEAAMVKALETTGLAPYLLSIPGIGIVTAAGFLAEVGDLAEYQDWRQLQKLAGLNLVEQSSGEKKGARTISKRGRPGLRSLLYKASLTLVAISLKLLRVMFTLGREKRSYDQTKVLGSYRQTQLQQAA